MSLEPAELDVLSRAQSLALLRSVPVGRLVFTDRALPAITPVNFGVTTWGDIVIQSDRGSKLTAALNEAVVAFEADSFDASTHDSWSVVVTGRAHVVARVDELRELADALPQPWIGPGGSAVIRVSADIVAGRKLPGHHVVPKTPSIDRQSQQ